MRRSLRSTQTNEGHDHDHGNDQDDQRRYSEAAPGLSTSLVNQVLDASRQSDDDASKDQQAHTIADAAVGDLLTQPHDEGRTGGQSQHGHEDKAGARIEHVRDTAARAVDERESDGQRLNDAQQNGDIPGPLCDLAPPQLPFLLQLG